MAQGFMDWVRGLPDWGKSIGLLGVVFGVGVAFAATLAGWVALPATVAQHDIDIARHSADIITLQRRSDDVNRRLDRVICLLEAIAEEESPLRCEDPR